MQVYLNFHEHVILLSCTEDSALKKLQQEFHYFVSESEDYVDTTMDLFREKPPKLPPMIAEKILDNCTIYRMGSRQYIDYQGQALTIWDTMEETVRIYSLNKERLIEVAFYALHTLLGQGLAKKGLSPLSATAVSLGHINALIMLPERGGKSSLFSQLLINPEVKIIAESSPLIDLSGFVHVFPTSMALEEKPHEGPLSKLEWHEFSGRWFAGLSQMEGRIEKDNLHHRTLLIAGYRLSLGQSILTSVPKWKMILPLFQYLILGTGLNHVREMFFKFHWSDIFKVLFAGVVRFISAIQILRKSRCYYFYMGPDLAYNAQLILDQLYEAQNSA